MLQGRTKLIGFLVLGLLIGCSGSSGEPVGEVVVVEPGQSNVGTDANVGTEPNQSDPSETDTDTTDAETDAPVNTDNSGATDDDETGDGGATDDGESTDDGTTGGTDGEGTDDGGTTTDGMTDYAIGSLADALSNNADLSSAFAALQDANLDEAIDNPANEWTLFLPTNDAFAALASPADFDLERHRASGTPIISSTLETFNGQALNMDDGSALIVDGGGTEPLTIANATVVTPDIVGNASLTVVHVIDTVIAETSDNPYPQGSLADVLFNRGDMTNVLAALERAGLDQALNDVANVWTLFLPTDSALTDPDDFDFQLHIYTQASLDAFDLTGLSGSALVMNNGISFAITGGAPEPLSIGGVTITEVNVRNIDETGSIVHIINEVLAPELSEVD